MNYNENITEALAVLFQLASASQSAAAHDVGPFNTKLMRRVVFYLDIGLIGGGATVDFHVEAAATSGGSYTTVAGTTITQITAGASNFVQVEVKAEALSAGGQGPWLKGVLTVGTAVAPIGVLALGTAGYYPSSDYNVVTPAQTLVA